MGHFMVFCVVWFACLFVGRLVRETLPMEVALEPRPKSLLAHQGHPELVLGAWRRPKEQK